MITRRMQVQAIADALAGRDHRGRAHARYSRNRGLHGHAQSHGHRLRAPVQRLIKTHIYVLI